MANQKPTRSNAELLTELGEAQAALELSGTEKTEAETRATYYMDRADDFEAQLDAPAATQGDVQDVVRQLAEPVLARDPFDAQNPHSFLSHPPGFMLGWKNPSYRDRHRGWRGWEKVEYTDTIGQNLGKYLQDPPRRMEHMTDNFVMRGDVVLCVLTMEMWQARQNKRVHRANRYAREHAADVQVDGPGKNNLSYSSIGGSAMPRPEVPPK